MSVHGTARFATREEVAGAGLLPGSINGAAPDGLMVGWWFETQYDFEPIAYRGDLHQLIVGGTGGGKFTTAIAPLLLGSSLGDQAVVVVDPKGEVADLAGPFFQEAFAAQASVFLLDPWDQCKTGQTSVLNFLAQITPDNPNYVDDARALADAIITPSGGENTHWDTTARNFLASILLYVALDPAEDGKRDLVRVRDIVTLPWQMPKSYVGPKRQTLSALLNSYLENDLAGGAIRRGFSGVLNREDRERSGVLSSIERDTAWIDSPQMAKVLRGESLDLEQAALGGGKYFVVIPPDFFMTHRAWLRLAVAAFSKAFKRYQPGASRSGPRRWRHIVIDEFANLGEMSFVMNDIAVSRGFAIKYTFAIQDLNQLARVYESGWETFINNSFQRVFALGDGFTSEYFSRLLGSATVASTSYSSGTSNSRSTSRGFSEGSSEGTNTSQSSGMGRAQSGMSYGTSTSYTTSHSDSVSSSQGQSTTQVQRALLTPDEIRRLGNAEQIIFFRGMHPIAGWRPPYWTIFPSLPKFSLGEILDTINRSPKSAAERAYFLDWREMPLLMSPEALPVREEPLALPPPARKPVPKPKKLDWRIKAGMGVVAVLLAFWMWPNKPAPPPVKPAYVPPPVIVPEAAPVKLAPPPPPPPRPKPARPVVPDANSVDVVPRKQASRDYFIKMIRENMDRCAPGHGEKEKALMKQLVYYVLTKFDYPPVQLGVEANLARRKDYSVFTNYMQRPNWSLAERRDVFETMLKLLAAQFGNLPTEIFIDRLYQDGNCPFGTVSEADYQPPGYAYMKLPIAGN